MKVQLLFTALAAVLFASCSTAPRPVARQDESPIRNAALKFTAALQTHDSDAVDQLTTHESDPEAVALSQAAIADAVKGREVESTLANRFGEMENRAGISGSDAWLAEFERTAATEPIMQSGNRVRIGEAGKAGTFFLRQNEGKWRVEAGPTLVAETGGRPKMTDPSLHYRLGVTLAVNAWMLERLERGEFSTMHDFMAAKSQFWFEFMAYAANGDDPRDKLLPSLPPLPAEIPEVADER